MCVVLRVAWSLLNTSSLRNILRPPSIELAFQRQPQQQQQQQALQLLQEETICLQLIKLRG